MKEITNSSRSSARKVSKQSLLRSLIVSCLSIALCIGCIAGSAWSLFKSEIPLEHAGSLELSGMNLEITYKQSGNIQKLSPVEDDPNTFLLEPGIEYDLSLSYLRTEDDLGMVRDEDAMLVFKPDPSDTPMLLENHDFPEFAAPSFPEEETQGHEDETVPTETEEPEEEPPIPEDEETEQDTTEPENQEPVESEEEMPAPPEEDASEAEDVNAQSGVNHTDAESEGVSPQNEAGGSDDEVENHSEGGENNAEDGESSSEGGENNAEDGESGSEGGENNAEGGESSSEGSGNNAEGGESGSEGGGNNAENGGNHAGGGENNPESGENNSEVKDGDDEDDEEAKLRELLDSLDKLCCGETRKYPVALDRSQNEGSFSAKGVKVRQRTYVTFQTIDLITDDVPAQTAVFHFDAVPNYYQDDYPNTIYGNGTVASNGCSAVSLAMIATYMTDHPYLPDEIARYFGGSAEDNVARMEKGLETLQIPYEKPENIDITYNGLLEGKVAIALMDQKSAFTNSQHFIVLRGVTENGRILVNDPNRYNEVEDPVGFQNGFTKETIATGYQGAWLFDKSQMPAEQFIYYVPESVHGVPRYPDIHLTADQKRGIAKIIYLEARGEGTEGQQAVAEVILNRLASNRFGLTLKDAIFSDDQFLTIDWMDKAEPYQSQYDAIERAIWGPNILPSDIYYFGREPVTNSVWGSIGNHVFSGPSIGEE